MRVLQVGMSSNMGGVESFVINYAKILYSKNIIFDYIACEPHLCHEEEIKKMGGKIYHIPNMKRHFVRAYIQLSNIMKHYDIVHVNMLCAANIVPILAAQKAGVKKIICHSHNTSTEGIVRFLFHYLNKNYVSRDSIIHLACSDAAARWMYKNEIVTKSAYTLIHNAVDFDKYKYSETNRRQIRESLGIDDSTVVLGNIGRITLQKNSVFLVEILAEVVKNNSNVKLLIVGKSEGNFGVKFESEVKRLGMSNYIICVGEKRDAYRYYSAMDVFLMPSLYEGLSFTAIEAQASGIRCIFSDTMVEETKIIENTYFLSIETPDIWASKILEDNLNCDRICGIKEQIINAGYDIETQGRCLEYIYGGKKTDE